MAIAFLTLDEVLAIHAHQVATYGGSPGLRDAGLLESAVAMPRVTFGGHHVHADLYEMSAAYLFHLVKNHPFVDGNKRVGLACALAFLRLNRVRISATDDELVALVMAVAGSDAGKSVAAVFLRDHDVRARR